VFAECRHCAITSGIVQSIAGTIIATLGTIMHEDESVINEVPGDTEHLLSKLHKRFEWKTALTKIK
jgi:hypothetical protein